MKVCISGSRSISKLHPEAIARINRIIELNATILIGDAPGVDVLVQSYLYSVGYDQVEIWHIGDRPRNNINSWPTVEVDSNRYMARDKAMCDVADFGLAIWDGESPGTKRNIQQLANRMRIVEINEETATASVW
jgi:hypothetical protein